MSESMAVSQHFIVWTCDKRRLSNWFLYYILQIKKPVFENVASGSTIKTIGLPFFKEMRIAIPKVLHRPVLDGRLHVLRDGRLGVTDGELPEQEAELGLVLRRQRGPVT